MVEAAWLDELACLADRATHGMAASEGVWGSRPTTPRRPPRRP